MKKGIVSRLIIIEILISLKKELNSFDSIFDEITQKHNIGLSDKKLIQSVVFCSMRNYLLINKIIKLYVKKINHDSYDYFLILSSIAQILFLNFKEYAVVNSAVEIAKIKKKLNPKFINGLLRNIIRNKIKNNFKLNFKDLPNWFVKNTKNWTNNQKINFLETIREKPSLHIVFKHSCNIDTLKLNGINTTKNSMIVNFSGKIENINGYKKGLWWVQDFSTMLPIYLIENLKNKLVIDMCAAPGGKTFQAINYGAIVESYDINNKKADLMRTNLLRLQYKNLVKNKDIKTISFKKKFDTVMLDAPCTSVGTIRRNPEIFYRKKIPNLKKIILNQYELLNKAKNIVKSNGVIIFMVCSFLKVEGENQVKLFLTNNKNYKIDKFKSENKFYNNFIDKNGFISIKPQKIDNDYFIDGFFAAKIIKDD